MLIMVVTIAVLTMAIMPIVAISDYFVNGYDVPYVLVVPLQIRSHCCYFHH